MSRIVPVGGCAVSKLCFAFQSLSCRFSLAVARMLAAGCLVVAMMACADESASIIIDQPQPPVLQLAEADAGTTGDVTTNDVLPPPAERTYDVPKIIKTRFGDLDVMEQARVVRILTVYGPGRFDRRQFLAWRAPILSIGSRPIHSRAHAMRRST